MTQTNDRQSTRKIEQSSSFYFRLDRNHSWKLCSENLNQNRWCKEIKINWFHLRNVFYSITGFSIIIWLILTLQSLLFAGSNVCLDVCVCQFVCHFGHYWCKQKFDHSMFFIYVNHCKFDTFTNKSIRALTHITSLETEVDRFFTLCSSSPTLPNT